MDHSEQRTHDGRGWKHTARFCISLIGFVLGIAASATFFFMYHQTEAASWAFISAMFAAVCLNLHILHHRNLLSVWHSEETLRSIQFMGFVVALVGYTFFIWYLFIGLYRHVDVHSLQDDNPYLCSVWAFMTAKQGTFIVIYSRMYARILISDVPLLRDA